MTTTAFNQASDSDGDLVAQSVRGNREAFGRIVSRYQALICSIAYSATGCVSTSEDLAQETFLTAWKQLTDLREPEKLRAWLCGIARNLVNHSARREGREPASDGVSLEAIETAHAAEPMPAEHAISAQEEAILWRSLERIPVTYREPLVLFYRQHQSIDEVAQALDLSEDTVKQRLSRGRKLLADQVMAFVEGALERSSPGSAFTMAVVASLPLYAASATAAGVGATAAKGSALAKSAWIVALVNALLAPMVSVLGAYFGIRAGLNATRTERERKLVWRQTWPILAVASVFTALLLSFVDNGDFWDSHPIAFIVLGVSVPLAYALWLVLTMHRATGDSRRLRERERREHPELFADDAASGRTPSEYRSRATLLGLPLVHIYWGIPGEHARPAIAWVAVGDRAIGVLFAMGGMAAGGISVGTVSVGVISIGAASAGLVTMAGVALGVMAIGGVAVGVVSCGGFAVGWTAALGALAVAHDFAAGGRAFAEHANDAAAQAFFADHRAGALFNWIFGALSALCILPPAWFAWHTRKQRKNR